MRNNITIGKGQIVDLFAVSGVPVGTNTIITLVTDKSIRLYLQPTAPVVGVSGYIPMDQGGDSKEISGNILGAWAYSDFGAVVNFSEDFTSTGGSSGGGSGASIATDMYFASTADRDAFTAANPDRIYQGVTSAVENGANYDYYQYDSSGKKWLSANRIYQGKEPFTTVKVVMLPEGSDPTSVINGDELDLGIPRSGSSPAPRQAVRFMGMFETEAQLNLQEPSPREGSQGIVLTPEQYYYEFTSNAWVKGRSVGDAHSGYLDRYTDLAALKTAHPTAPKDSTAIAGLAWYIYETNAWEPLQDDHIPAIDNKLQSLEVGQQTLEGDLNQKISGIHIEDDEGNSFGDITGLAFDGAIVQDDQGTGLASVIVKPKITVANGQEPGSTSVTGNAIVIDGSNVSNDPNDPDVIILDIQTGGNSGIEIDNNVANMAGVKKLNFPTSEILARSPTEADIIPYLKANDHDGTDALVEELNILPPLQLNKQQGEQFKHDLIIDPRAYEKQHAASCLLRLAKDESIQGGKSLAVYCDQEIVPTGEYFSLNAEARGLNVQDNTGGDTALTGGELTEVLACVGFFGKAPENGNIKIWIKYEDKLNPTPQNILIDTNGKPVIFERSYTQGQDLNTGGMPIVLAGAMYAKGQSPIVLMIETSFSQINNVVIDPDKTMLGVNQFSDGYETSLTRIEFQRRCGVEITPSINKFEKSMFKLSDEIAGITQIQTVVGIGEGEDMLNNFGTNNLTPIVISIENGVVTTKDNGSAADFYYDAIIDSDRTTMLRGKDFSSFVTINNPDCAWNLALFKWVGKADQPSKLYSSRNNGAVEINDGWTLITNKFITENTAGNYLASIVNGVIPGDAVNIGIFLYPVNSQSPLVLNQKEFDLGPESVFTGYVEISRLNANEKHLSFDEKYAEFITNNRGYRSLRYTIGSTAIDGYPMPAGKLQKGKAGIVVDNNLNKVSGSMDPENDGAYKLSVDAETLPSVSYLVFNEGAEDVSLTFHDVLFAVGATDGQETKIIESEYTHPVKIKPNTAHGVVVTVPAYAIELEVGQTIGHRVIADKAGCYVESDASNQYLNQTTFDLKELKPDAADDPWAVIDFTQYTASYFNNVVVSKIVENSDTAVFIVDLPVNGTFTIMEVLQEDTAALGSITGKNDFSFEWDKATKEITFDFKKVGSYRIMMMLSI